MKKKILLITVIAMFFSMTCFTFADTAGDTPETDDTAMISEDITELTAESCGLGFKKTSSTKAQAQAVASRSSASSITSTIYLQKKSGSSYSTVSSDKKTVKSTRINHIHTFSISSSATYRIKVVIKYTRDGSTRSNTFYKNL